MTDGELAFEEAYMRGADRVILCGAFGGQRTDHTLLHLTMATAQAAKGRNVLLSSGSEEARLCRPEIMFMIFRTGRRSV